MAFIMKNDILLGFAVVVTCVLMIACASTFDASNVHHNFGFGSKVHVTTVPDSANVSSQSN